MVSCLQKNLMERCQCSDYIIDNMTVVPCDMFDSIQGTEQLLLFCYEKKLTVETLQCRVSTLHCRVSTVSFRAYTYKTMMTSSMETFSALLAICAGNSPRSPVNSPHKGQWRGALIFSLICALNKRLSKQSWAWWFETPSCSLWRHCNGPSRYLHPPLHGILICVLANTYHV